ncbi:hypothetical protein D1007_13596 [Hordeum vulgare]|nr:hypothetical protein D1007_13596 [Hordeum vulgare]
MYMMGIYLLPEGVHNAFDKELTRFFWQARNGRPKYHMVKWADICVPKDRGGLGIPVSRRMYVALMLRWVWRILQGDGGLWLQLIEAKYLRRRPLLACSLAKGSQFWKSIQSIKHEIRLGLRVSVGNGSGTKFWMPVLPWLSPLWKAPLPLKIKIFVWQLLRDRLPFGTEVLKHHGPGNGICPMCHVLETGSHILFSCIAAQALWCFVHEALGPEWEAYNLADFLQVRATQVGRKRQLFWLVFAAMTWTLWTTRNKMVIESVFQRRASDSFFKFLAFLQLWHPLVRPRDRDRLQRYLDALMVAARRISSTSLAS